MSDTRRHDYALLPGDEKSVGDEKKIEVKADQIVVDLSTPQKKSLLALNHEDFLPGDILLFLPPATGLNCGQKLICCFQACMRRQHGHYEITHAAIFTSYQEKKNKRIPKIADVTGKDFRIGALKENQPVLVFRPSNPSFANSIADQALQVTLEKNRPYWSCCTGLCMMFRRKQLDPSREIKQKTREISTNTVCSKFTIQIIKKAVNEFADLSESKKFNLNIQSDSSVKDLEAELYQNPNYSMHIAFGKNNLKGSPFLIIQEEVKLQLQRLTDKTKNRPRDHLLKLKLEHASTVFKDTMTSLENSKQDDIEKAIELAEAMLEPFSVNTGCGFRTTSKDALQASMKRLNLFNSVVTYYRDIEQQEFTRNGQRPRLVSEDLGLG